MMVSRVQERGNHHDRNYMMRVLHSNPHISLTMDCIWGKEMSSLLIVYAEWDPMHCNLLLRLAQYVTSHPKKTLRRTVRLAKGFVL